MSQILYSVIIPVYNSENFLNFCIESVLRQTYRKFELILVDDGSSDRSYEILEYYQKKDARIKIIKKLNEGQLKARLDGIKVSKGDYILFLDSDDYWKENLLERVNQNILKNKSDVVVFDFAVVENSRIVKNNKYFTNTSEKVINKSDYLLQWAKDTNLNAVWTKAFRKAVFSWDLSSKKYDIKSGEDLLMNIPLIQNANTITYLPESLYYYRSNPDGVSSNFRKEKIKDLLISRGEFHSFLNSYNSSDVNKSATISTFTIIAGTVSALLQTNIKNKKQLLTIITESELYKQLDKTTINELSSIRLLILLKLLNRRQFMLLTLFEKIVYLISQLSRR